MGFTPCKDERPLQGMELQEKETQEDERIQEICLERKLAKESLIIYRNHALLCRLYDMLSLTCFLLKTILVWYLEN